MPFFFIFIIFASPLSFDFSFADFSHILFQAITIFAARCLRFISMLTLPPCCRWPLPLRHAHAIIFADFMPPRFDTIA
jgi:hypothetical protein